MSIINTNKTKKNKKSYNFNLSGSNSKYNFELAPDGESTAKFQLSTPDGKYFADVGWGLIDAIQNGNLYGYQPKSEEEKNAITNFINHKGYSLTTENGIDFGKVSYGAYNALTKGDIDTYTPIDEEEAKVINDYKDTVGYGKTVFDVKDQYSKDKFGKGNIDLSQRPIYTNADGKISTVSSMSIGVDGKEVLIPTVVWDENGKAKKLTEEEAIEHYYKTGQHLGIFDSVSDANKYANKLHVEQELYYDFVNNSQYKSTKNGKKEKKMYGANGVRYIDTGYDDIEHDYINGDKRATEIVTLNESYDGDYFYGYDSEFLKEMTDDQKAIYNYIYNKYGKEAGKEYIKTISSELYASQRAKNESMMSDYAKEHKFKSSAASVLLSPLKVYSLAGQVGDYLDDGKIDQNAGYNKFVYNTNAVRSTVADEISKGWSGDVGAFLYNTGMSIGDSAMNTVVSGGTKYLSLGMMGAGAWANEVVSAKDRGLSDNQAMGLGVISAAAEIITESFSYDALFGAKNVGKTFGQGATQTSAKKYLLDNIKTNAFEELGADGINFVADLLIAQDKSQLAESIDKYIKAGNSKSKAWALAFKDTAQQFASSFLAGALSGGTMSGPTAIFVNSRIKKIGQANSNNVLGIIGDGLNFDQNSEAYKNALKLANSKGEITDADLGTQVLLNDVQKITNTINEGLKQDKNSEAYKNALKLKKSKGEITQADLEYQEMLNNSKAAVSVGDSFTDSKYNIKIKVVGRDADSTTIETTNLTTGVVENRTLSNSLANTLLTDDRYTKVETSATTDVAKAEPTESTAVTEPTTTEADTIAVGDTFASTGTGNIATVVGRDANNTTMQVVKSDKVETVTMSNDKLNKFVSDGRLTKIDSAESTPSVADTTEVTTKAEEPIRDINLKRVGRYYEAYGEDALLLAEALDGVETTKAVVNGVETDVLRLPADLAEKAVSAYADEFNLILSDKPTSTEVENATVTDETTTSDETIPTEEESATEVEISDVANAIEETLTEQAKADLQNGEVKDNYIRIAETLMEVYKADGTIEAFADFFVDGGKKVEATIKGETDNSVEVLKNEATSDTINSSNENDSVERKDDSNERRSDSLSGDSRRGYNGSARKQAERISYFERENQGRDATERQNFTRELTERGQIEEVTVGRYKYILIKPEAYNDDMLSMVEEAKKKGVELQFIVGKVRVAFDTKDEFTVRGLKLSSSKVIVQYDNAKSPQKIAKHEIIHAKWNTPEIQAIKETILDSLTAEDKQDILSQDRYSRYMEMYKGDENAVLEEFVCDVMSGDSYYYADHIDMVNDYWYGNETVEGYDAADYATTKDAGGKYDLLDEGGEYDGESNRERLEAVRHVHKGKDAGRGTVQPYEAHQGSKNRRGKRQDSSKTDRGTGTKAIKSLSKEDTKNVRYDLADDNYAPTFYSQLGKVTDAIKQEKIGVKDYLNYIKDTKRGVKNEEIKWSGIEDFLEGKKSVTKAELQEFIAGNQLQIEETVLDGGDAVTIKQSAYEPNDFVIMRGSAVYDTLAWNESDKVWVSDTYGYYFESETNIRNYYGVGKGGTRWGDYKLDGGENYREITFKMPNSDYTNKAMQTHWGENAKGILVHARIQDFDVDGKKMLFIEELQSDWHNEGHKIGYAPKNQDSRIAEAKRLFDRANLHTIGIDEFLALQDDLGQILFELELEGIDASVILRDTVPDAPFHDNYHEYALKRIIRMAAEQGYDSIGWTPSEIQMERWNPARQTNAEMRITDAKNPNAIAFEDGYRIEYDQDIPKFLNKYGKKWGTRVGKTPMDTGMGENTVHYVDESGNRSNSYNNLIDDILARHGISEDKFNDYSAVFVDDETIKIRNPKDGSYLDEEIHMVSEPSSVWSMDITDSMKESVLYEGQARYDLDDRDNEYMKAVESGDTETVAQMIEDAAEKSFPNSKVRGDDGKLKLVYHGRVSDFNVFDRQFANIEGDFGKGYYFTSNEYDVDANYANEEGPDFKNKIDRYAEQLEYNEEYEDLSYEERQEIARQKFITSEPNTITAYLNMENPVYITPDEKGTFLNYDYEYDEEYDEYGEPEGLLIDFIEALNSIASDYSYRDVDFNFLYEYGMDNGGMYAADAVKTIKNRIIDELSDDEGNIATNEVIRLAFEEIGFDGIIDSSVYYKFRNMDGMDSGTTHYIVFDSEQIKSADLVTYDDDGNVIPISERFNKNNKDIRYDIDSKNNLETQKKIEKIAKEINTHDELIEVAKKNTQEFVDKIKENKSLQKRLDNAKRQTLLSPKPIINVAQVGKVTKDILKEMDSTLKATDLKDEIISIYTEYFDNMKKASGVESKVQEANDNMMKRFANLAIDIAESAEAYAESEEYLSLKAYLKDVRIKVPDHAKGEAHFGEFRKSHMGTFNLTNDGLDIDTVYQELCEMFPGMFDVEVANAVDQLYAIADKVEALKPYAYNPHLEYMAEAVDHIVYRFASEVDGIAATPKTKAQKIAEKGAYDKEMALEKERASFERKLDRHKKNSEKTIQALQKKIGDSEYVRYWEKRLSKEEKAQAVNKVREKQKVAVLKTQIRNIVADMKKKLDKTEKNGGYPKELVKAVADVCSVIDFHTDRTNKDGTPTKASLKLDALKMQYDALKNSPNYDFQTEYSDEISNRILKLHQKIENKRVVDLTFDELSQLKEILGEINHSLATASEQIGKANTKANYEIATDIINDLHTNNKAISEFKNSLLREMKLAKEKGKAFTINPHRIFEMLSNYDKNSALWQLYDQINRGARASKKFTMDATLPFDELTDGGGNEIAFYDFRTKLHKTGIKFEDGTDVEIPKSIICEIVMLWDRKQGRNHLEAGGFKIPDLKLFNKGQTAESLAVGKKTNAITQADITRLKGMLDSYDKAWIERSRHLFNNVAKNAINEISMQLLGREIAKADNYIRIYVDSDFVNKDIGKNENDITIEGHGSLKETTPDAKNPVVLRGLHENVFEHIDFASRYYGLAIPIRNFNKVYKISIKDGDSSQSIRSMLGSTFGPKIRDGVVVQVIKDLQSPRPREISMFNKVRGKWLTSVFWGNIKSTLKQTTSYWTSSSILDESSLIKGLGSYIAHRKQTKAEIAKYSGTLYNRSQGLSTTELGDRANRKRLAGLSSKTTKFINEKLPVLRKVPEWIRPGNWLQSMDCATSSALWDACKHQVSKTMNASDDGYMKAVADLYERVIEETQSNYDMLHRPEILKSTNPVNQTLGMFQNDNLQQTGIMYGAFNNLRAKQKAYKADKSSVNEQNLKDAKKRMDKAIRSRIYSSMWLVLVSTLGDALLRKFKPYIDDEDKEITSSSVLEQAMLNMAEDTFGIFVPVYGQLVTKAVDTFNEGYDFLNDPSFDVMEDFIKATSKIWDAYAEDGDVLKALVDAVPAISNMTGIPAKNISDLYKSVKGYMGDIKEGEFAHDLEDYTSGNKSFYNYGDLASYIASGDKEKETKWKDYYSANGKEFAKGSLTKEIKPAYVQMYLDSPEKAYNIKKKLILDYDYTEADIDGWLIDEYLKQSVSNPEYAAEIKNVLSNENKWDTTQVFKAIRSYYKAVYKEGDEKETKALRDALLKSKDVSESTLRQWEAAADNEIEKQEDELAIEKAKFED